MPPPPVSFSLGVPHALRCSQVPAHAPQTRDQWQAWGTELWPLTWKPPPGSSCIDRRKSSDCSKNGKGQRDSASDSADGGTVLQGNGAALQLLSATEQAYAVRHLSELFGTAAWSSASGLSGTLPTRYVPAGLGCDSQWGDMRATCSQPACANAACIVDPVGDVVVGLAADGRPRGGHPLHHAVMLAVEQVGQPGRALTTTD
jgi:hypothetical protein